MNPFSALDRFAELLEHAGLPATREPFESSERILGESSDHEALLDIFCDFARTPLDREVRRGGARWKVPDHPDADLLLHESGLEEPDDGGGGASFYAVTFGRQFSFEDRRGDYVGMNIVDLSLEAEGVPDGRVPTAQRWGYGGPRRPDVSDDAHPEGMNWAGHVDAWAAAVRGSNSWKVFDALPVRRFRIIQSDV